METPHTHPFNPVLLEVFGHLPAFELLNHRTMEIVTGDFLLGPTNVNNYFSWLAREVEPLLTDSRRYFLEGFSGADKIHRLLLQLHSDGVDLSSITCSLRNSRLLELETTSDIGEFIETDLTYGIEEAIQRGDAILNHNLNKIANRIPGYEHRALGVTTLAGMVAYFRAWITAHSVGCREITNLDLSDLNLSALPSELSLFFPNLRKLNLSRNELTLLPESLGRLTQLRVLHLSFNRLTSLPESLGNLTQLQVLVLSFNRVSSLPESLGNLSQLETLSLPSNLLTSLPESLFNLTQLKDFSLAENPVISGLPLHGSMSALSAIKTILALPEDPVLMGVWTSIQALGTHSTEKTILMSMHDLNVCTSSDIRAIIIAEYNRVKNPIYDELSSDYDTSLDALKTINSLLLLSIIYRNQSQLI